VPAAPGWHQAAGRSAITGKWYTIHTRFSAIHTPQGQPIHTLLRTLTLFNNFISMALKRYSTKEPQIFLWVMIPYIMLLNLLVFGSCILESVGLFLKNFLVSALYLFVVYFLFGMVAVFIRNRIPAAGDLFRRISVMLPVFYVMNVAAIGGLYVLYNNIHIIDCQARPRMFLWSIFYGCIMSTVITFMNEGMANWEAWKASITETEKLKNSYHRSRLLGLKGQINPHFLFNCFNTLSGLIQEDEAKAEKFLDEMTKVHRYLLRSDDELLVPVCDEIKFAQSYLYLTRERFGSAIQATIQVKEDVGTRRMPPLSMQVVLENIIYTNAISKKDPLTIEVKCSEDKELRIRHTLHEKIIVQNLDMDEGLDNLLNKYRLLHPAGISIHETPSDRTIVLPLLNEKEVPL
jgi:two-component system, LytTR family, sensor kinase